MPSLRHIASVAFCLLVARAAAAPAPADSVPPPSVPFVAAVPDRIQWTVTVASPPPPQPEAANARRQIIKIHFTKAGRIAQRVISYSDGTTWDVWFADGMELDPGPGGAIQVLDPASFRGPDTPLGSPLLPGGFPGTEWVSPTHYDTVVPFQRTSCYHYVAPDPNGTVAVQAWIDVVTKLPQGFVSQGVTYLYAMQDPPAGPLTLPPAYQAALDQFRKAVERRDRLSAGPPR